jgi:IS30 family transposase
VPFGTIVDEADMLLLISNRKSKTVTHEFAKLLNKHPQYLRKTMTYDNGIEMANHKWLSESWNGYLFYILTPHGKRHK